MANMFLLLAILSAGASLVFSAADGMAGQGSSWANHLCSMARSLCHSPTQVAYVAVAFAALWLVTKFVAAVRD